MNKKFMSLLIAGFLLAGLAGNQCLAKDNDYQNYQSLQRKEYKQQPYKTQKREFQNRTQDHKKYYNDQNKRQKELRKDFRNDAKNYKSEYKQNIKNVNHHKKEFKKDFRKDQKFQKGDQKKNINKANYNKKDFKKKSKVR